MTNTKEETGKRIIDVQVLGCMPASFARESHAWIKLGFQPFGGVAVMRGDSSALIYQTFVKYEDNEKVLSKEQRAKLFSYFMKVNFDKRYTSTEIIQEIENILNEK